MMTPKQVKEHWKILLWIIILLIILFAINPIHARAKSEQIVLKVTVSKDGRIYAEPQKVFVEISLVPENSTDHYAPLPPGTNMICRMRNTTDNEHPAIAWDCGLDKYKMASIAFGAK